MDYVEKPARVSRQILRLQRLAAKRDLRVTKVRLNIKETRTFWEDLIEEKMLDDNPNDDVAFAAFVATSVYEYFDTDVRLNVEGV